MTETKLAKISSVGFGVGGYQNMQFGLHITFSGDGWGICTSDCTLDKNQNKWSKHCKWTEEDRDQEYVDIVHRLSDILHKAKVKDVSELKGIPVEVTIEGMGCGKLSSWRVLEEVL